MFIAKHVLMNAAGDGGDGGGGGVDLAALQASMTDMKTQLSSQNEELERLRAHAGKLLDEKKKLQADFKAFEGLGDAETVGNMIKQFQNNEDARLVAEGKFDEVLTKHTQRQQLEFKAKLEELTDALTKSKTASAQYETLYHESEAGHAIRAVAAAAGVRDTALDDILLRGKGLFAVSDDGTLEARDKEGNLRVVNGKPLTPELFVAGLRDKYPHYWPESQSGGARGGTGHGSQPNPFKKGSKDYSITEQARLRKTDPALAEQLAAEAATARG